MIKHSGDVVPPAPDPALTLEQEFEAALKACEQDISHGELANQALEKKKAHWAKEYTQNRLSQRVAEGRIQACVKAQDIILLRLRQDEVTRDSLTYKLNVSFRGVQRRRRVDELDRKLDQHLKTGLTAEDAEEEAYVDKEERNERFTSFAKTQKDQEQLDRDFVDSMNQDIAEANEEFNTAMQGQSEETSTRLRAAAYLEASVLALQDLQTVKRPIKKDLRHVASLARVNETKSFQAQEEVVEVEMEEPEVSASSELLLSPAYSGMD
jgi:carboxypeptidase C (cathepsin A)